MFEDDYRIVWVSSKIELGGCPVWPRELDFETSWHWRLIQILHNFFSMLFFMSKKSTFQKYKVAKTLEFWAVHIFKGAGPKPFWTWVKKQTSVKKVVFRFVLKLFGLRHNVLLLVSKSFFNLCYMAWNCKLMLIKVKLVYIK